MDTWKLKYVIEELELELRYKHLTLAIGKTRWLQREIQYYIEELHE